MNRIPILILLLALTACSDGSTDTEPVAPANVVIHSASAVPIYQGTRITASMENNGGPGGFKIRTHFNSSVPNQSGPSAESETYPVIAGWKETLTWEVTGTSSSPASVVILTHSEGSLQYRETARHEFECCS